jgi:ribonuclease-3
LIQIDLKRLCRKLQYEFNDISLLKQALTHRSLGSINNERLEFLGDSILSFVIARTLFGLFPEKSEGQLSYLRAYLVKGDMLAEIATELQLGDFLYLGQGELRSGGHRRISILADALEAIIAAIFLDGGMEQSQALILRLYDSRLKDKSLPDTLKDAKTQLQEFAQGKKMPLPLYTLDKVEGEGHNQLFYVTCILVKLNQTAHGVGNTRRKAEQEAAALILAMIK